MTRLLFPIRSKRQRLANLLRCCSKKSLPDQGVQVHAATVKMGFGFDLMLSNDLVDMYAKCGIMDMASLVFDRMIERNVVSWTALMCGHLQNGNARATLSLFYQMVFSCFKPNEFTFSTNFKACGILNVLEIGMQIHGMCVISGFDCALVVGNSIVDMYSKCGRINEALTMFNVLQDRNLISWNTIIAGYTLAGQGEKALVLFHKMQQNGEIPDEYTFTTMLKACSGLRKIREGSVIHGFLITSGFPCSGKAAITGSLIDLYVKCGNLIEARMVFNQIAEKNLISWSALILGYAQEGNLAEAVELFRQLQNSTTQVDGFVLSSMMGVFADFALVEQGKQMHAYAVKIPSGLEISVHNSIVDMYLKCGMLDEAEKLFNEMPTRNVVSWTVMITGYGKHGFGKEAIHFFYKMQLDNIEPDRVTYLAILSACSHSGLIKEGEECFSQLCRNRWVKPGIEHYACMVDLLGRDGRLKEAKDLIESMPLKPNVGIWQTLLSACRVHGDLQLGKEVGQNLLTLDGDNPVNYVMVSNIYAGAGYWMDCEEVRELAKAKGLKKEAGRSWVEIDKEVHFFHGGDNTHPLTEKIHQVLKEMEKRMKQDLGYVHEVKFALRDIDEESKEESLRVHSEKLAIGLALLHGGWAEARVIRVFKNLRICGDCHDFIKFLSKILKVVLCD
ncbi:putative pentatricopeptide repeat-containing protein At3g15130 [Durio zibethinus]|uniref:Pentatricopeptide repeat-containing protein At3g15130 n=1 Tax=Durio zibethinus TaxID=66656 RepID=A0A6P5ZMJ9_DURZI|nr:putative pentatricopeptide repeat-containing protein At3g15130 [Durio zibethinus]